jgi:serine phosphatase RsbU (regulator of sigma subunit)
VAAPAGLHAAFGFPIHGPRGFVGVIEFFDRRIREPNRALLSTMTAVGNQIGQYIERSALEQERKHIAGTLQKSLRPPPLPEIPGVELAARYRPAGEAVEVGGDFYDLFAVGESSWGLVIGDVSGKGAEAAALTGLARYTVRASAMRERSPRRILSLLNDAILDQRSSERQFCTVAFARLEGSPEGPRSLILSSGGHPLPVIVRENGTVEEAGRPGMLLGIVPEPELAEDVVGLRPGDALVLYTDGVIETRTPQGVFGHSRLTSLLSHCAGLSAESISERIDQAVTEAAVGEPRDDVAVLVLRVIGRERAPRHAAASERVAA